MSNRKPVYPTIVQVFGLLGIFVGLSIIFGLLLAPLFGRDDEFFGAITLVSYVVPMVILSLFAVKLAEINWKEAFGGLDGNDWMLYGMLVLLVIANTFIVDPILSFFPIPPKIEEMFKMIVKPSPGSFITVVIGAAFLEEYVFRGIVLRGFLRNYSPMKAIVWSAALFGLFHFNPWQFVAAGIIGIYMGWIYYRTRSLWPCIFIHFVNNLLSYVTFMVSENQDMAFYDFSENIPLALASVTGGIAAVYMIYKVLDKRLPQSVDIEEQTIENHDAET